MHDKLHELHCHFPPIAQRTSLIITSSCWKSTVSDVTASGIDQKKGRIVRLLWQSEIFTITKQKNTGTLMCLHFKVCHYDFNIEIYCVRFFSYKSPLFWTHSHFWLTGQTNLWRSAWTRLFFYQYRMAWRHYVTFSTTWSNYRGSSLSNWRKMGM